MTSQVASHSSRTEPPKLTRSIARLVGTWDIGAMPVVLGLILIALIFQAANSNFLSPLNLTNLMVQIASTGTIAIGVVLVLLIAEIDLSVGAVSGFCASIMAVLSVKNSVPAPLAVGAGIVSGILVGLIQGFWFAKLRVPSFIVTLAGLLSWQGALLYVLGSTGTVNLTDPWIIGIANMLLPPVLGWSLGIIFILALGVSTWLTYRHRRRMGFQDQSAAWLIARVLLVAAIVLGAIAIMTVNRSPTGFQPIQGVPSAVVIFIGLIIVFDFITQRTKFGRYVFAIGGNVEAARRAGVNVDRIRILVFMLASMLAACGGILAASRLFAVNQSSGGGDVLLNAIAAAVIGGTSLFGGRGSTWSALLGVLVIGSISNGMDLLAFSSYIKFMVTGVVLLLAVTLDSFARSRREASGR